MDDKTKSYLDTLPRALQNALNVSGSPAKTISGTTSYLNRQKKEWFAARGLTIDLMLVAFKENGQWVVKWDRSY